MRDTRFIISGQAYFLINSWENFKGNECPGVHKSIICYNSLFYFLDELENLLISYFKDIKNIKSRI